MFAAQRIDERSDHFDFEKRFTVFNNITFNDLYCKFLSRIEQINLSLFQVTADMQTHKNPALKAQGPIERTPGANATKAQTSTTPNARSDPPPKTQLENGKQWNVVSKMVIVYFFHRFALLKRNSYCNNGYVFYSLLLHSFHTSVV